MGCNPASSTANYLSLRSRARGPPARPVLKGPLKHSSPMPIGKWWPGEARMATPAVVLEGITKSFGAHVAVRELSLQVPSGSIYGFIGPNGSGKTTTLRLIMRIYRPDRGRVV